jgi:hypothetical protein
MSDKVELSVTNTVTYIKGKLNSQVYKELKKLVGYRPEDAFFRMRRSNTHWDGIETTLCYNKKWCRCAIKKDGTHFPTGLFNKVKEFLTKNNIPFDAYDLRESVQKSINLTMSDKFELRDYQQEVIKNAIERQRGIIKAATGSGKCLGKGTPVLMYDGSIKKVEEIIVGDLIMGPDSLPRKVLSTTAGEEELFKITPKRGEPFVVNKSHILSLVMTGGYYKKQINNVCYYQKSGKIINISVSD